MKYKIKPPAHIEPDEIMRWMRLLHDVHGTHAQVMRLMDVAAPTYYRWWNADRPLHWWMRAAFQAACDRTRSMLRQLARDHRRSKLKHSRYLEKLREFEERLGDMGDAYDVDLSIEQSFDCADLLYDYLVEHGPSDSENIMAYMRKRGFNEQSAQRAGTQLHVRKKLEGYGVNRRSVWRLPYPTNGD